MRLSLRIKANFLVQCMLIMMTQSSPQLLWRTNAIQGQYNHNQFFHWFLKLDREKSWKYSMVSRKYSSTVIIRCCIDIIFSHWRIGERNWNYSIVSPVFVSYFIHFASFLRTFPFYLTCTFSIDYFFMFDEVHNIILISKPLDLKVYILQFSFSEFALIRVSPFFATC